LLDEKLNENLRKIQEKDIEINELRKLLEDQKLIKKDEYEKIIAELTQRLKDAHQAARKTIENLELTHQKEQRLMTSAIYELGQILSELLAKKKKGEMNYESLAKLNTIQGNKNLTIVNNNNNK